MKLALQLLFSLAVLAVCVWLVWPAPAAQAALATMWRAMSFAALLPPLLASLALLAVCQLARTWRWGHLLEPLGVSLPNRQLFAISAVGFMAIVAFPARLGELVRPALLRQTGRLSASAALGTVAVERIIDGLIVSLLVFACALGVRGTPHERGWAMPLAWTSLAIFAGAMTILLFALRWRDGTLRLFLAATQMRRFWPRGAQLATTIVDKIIDGFRALAHRRAMTWFLALSAVYWVANALSIWVLARGMHLPISLVAAFAVMGIIAVGVSVPNAPGMVGQFHYLTVLGLSLYMSQEQADAAGLAFAIVLHAQQVGWYLVIGGLALLTRQVSLADLWRARPIVEAAEREAERNPPKPVEASSP